MPRLKVLPQFANLQIPAVEQLSVLIQGFGAVGAHAARIMKDRLPSARVVGISDLEGYLYDDAGLPSERLYQLWQKQGLVSTDFYTREIAPAGHSHSTKFSSNADNLLRESAFCLVPAAAVFNYLDVTPSTEASMTVDRMGQWAVIVEGANTYSPDPNRKAMRIRMEQEVYRRKGVMIANDYLVNSGGVNILFLPLKNYKFRKKCWVTAKQWINGCRSIRQNLPSCPPNGWRPGKPIVKR